MHLSLVLKANMKSRADHFNVYSIKLTSIYVYVSNKSILLIQYIENFLNIVESIYRTFLLMNSVVWYLFQIFFFLVVQYVMTSQNHYFISLVQFIL